eukprot:Skav234377  [mRNA]  locus=scaffold2071:184200:185763:- [translate_table: standard]
MARSRAPAVLLAALVLSLGSAFAGCGGARRELRRLPRAAENFIPLDAVEPAVTSYVNIWTPLFKSAQESGLAPEFLIHWGHAGAMATVLLAMGGYGTFLGWSTRLGNGNAVYPLSLGQTAAQLHPQLMGLALFLFFLGGQGGLVLLATQGQPILQSAHSSTAVIGLGLMAVQAALGVTMGDSSEKRTIHAVLGTAVTCSASHGLIHGTAGGG